MDEDSFRKMYLLLVILAFVHSGGCQRRNPNKNNLLLGRIIHIKSWTNQYKGEDPYWLCATRLSYGYRSNKIIDVAENLIWFQSWSQFLVKECDGKKDTVCLESIKRPGEYLAARMGSPPWYELLKKSAYANGVAENWFQWFIGCTDDTMSSCWFRSKFKPIYFLDSNNKLERRPAKDYIGTKWEILAPVPTEEFKVLKSITNEASDQSNPAAWTRDGSTGTWKRSVGGPTTVEFNVGIERSPQAKHLPVTENLAKEVELAFLKANQPMNDEWEKNKASAFKESVKRTATITVPPSQRYVIKQLAGKYGPFNVNCNHFQVTCTDLKTNSECVANELQFAD